MAIEDREYELLGELCDDPSFLEKGEAFLRIKQWRAIKRLLYPFIERADELHMIIKKFRYKRSLAQNAWLWGPCITSIGAFMKETEGIDYPKHAIKVYIETKILGYDIKTVDMYGMNVIYMDGKSLKDMNTKEFADAQQKIVDYYEPFGCIIPLSKGMNTISEHLNKNNNY